MVDERINLTDVWLSRPHRFERGVKGNGAGIDNAGIIAANGMLILNSGSGLSGGNSGNVT
jgi:hypothetical protein